MNQTERLPLMMDSKIDRAIKNKSGVYNLGFDDSALHDAVDHKEYWDDEFDEDSILLAENIQRGTTLIWNDYIITVVEYIQWVALIQATGLKWPLPSDWITYTSWIFAFNLDIWELIKIYTADHYKSVQGYVTDSTLMPLRFLYILIGWGVVLFMLILAYCIAYFTLTKSRHPFLLTKIAKMQRVYIILFQVLSFPVGMVVGKMFHCALPVGSDVQVMDVANENTCFNGIQLAYAAVCTVVALPFFFVFSVWLIKKTKLEIIFAHAKGHEAYLQLKETEYARGLDIMYIISSFHVFSSFRLRAVHYRAALHLLKFVMIIVYAAAHSYPYAQAVTMGILMFGYWIGLTILRPYRVKVFNIQLIINYLLLTIQLLIGALRTSFDVYSIRSAWFTPTYTLSSLIILNGVFFIANVVIFIYLMLHQCNVIKTPLWPTMTSQGVEKLGQHTQKYMRAVLRARHVVERSLSLPVLFAPAHELSRQIQIVNAYCREAEMLDDPLQDTLWHLLDELIETHSKISPRSLFADSVKDSIRSTATELMSIMPSFVERLSQREYDFLLITPLKRRILLKMFCLGMFLSKVKKDPDAKLNKSALQVVWNEKNHKHRENANYLAELQPQTEDRPGVNVTAANIRREQLLSDEASVDSMDMDHENSTVVDIDEMMAGIPSRPSTATRNGSKNGSPPRSGSVLSGSRPGTGEFRASRPGTAEHGYGRPAQPSLLKTALVQARRPATAQAPSSSAGVVEVQAVTRDQGLTKITEL